MPFALQAAEGSVPTRMAGVHALRHPLQFSRSRIRAGAQGSRAFPEHPFTESIKGLLCYGENGFIPEVNKPSDTMERDPEIKNAVE